MDLKSNKVPALAAFSEHLIPAVSCNLCGSLKRKEWARIEPIIAYKCDDCGLVYHDPQLTDKGRNLFYASGYFELQNDPADALARNKMYEVEINFLEKYARCGKILDVGCGGGFLLNKFGSLWEKYGIEFDHSAVENARRVFNLDVKEGEANEAVFPDVFFDVIVLRGVIEHMAEPKKMLKHLVRFLKSGGLLYITSTPNVESLCAELYREKWNLFTADHQIHFPKRTIIELGKELGMSLLDSAYFYLETPYSSEIEDYRKIIGDSNLIAVGKKDEASSSPAFYGNMFSLIFKKNSQNI